MSDLGRLLIKQKRIEELEAALMGVLRREYRMWRCDDGTFDVVDSEGAIVFCNLGRPNDEASAWLELAKRLGSP